MTWRDIVIVVLLVIQVIFLVLQIYVRINEGRNK